MNLQNTIQMTVMRSDYTRKARKFAQEMKKEIQYVSVSQRPRKILFDHLPKCGGTSLSEYFEAHYPRRKTFSIDGRHPLESANEFKTLPQCKRYSYDLVKGHMNHELLGYVHPECLKVTVIRDPVDRIISHYYYAKRRTDHYLHKKIKESEMNLEQYVTSNISIELRNWYTHHFSGLPIEDAERNPEESVAKAVESVVQQYDIVGFLDNLKPFIENLREQAKLRYEFHDLRRNLTRDRPSVENIPQIALNKIQEINYLDILFYEKIRAELN